MSEKESVWTRPLFGAKPGAGDVQERIARDLHVVRLWIGFWSVLGVIGLVIWLFLAVVNAWGNA